MIRLMIRTVRTPYFLQLSMQPSLMPPVTFTAPKKPEQGVEGSTYLTPAKGFTVYEIIRIHKEKLIPKDQLSLYQH